jgi:hypothetical protein
MSFNFDDLLNQGKEAADNVIQNEKEVDAVLKDLKVSLSKFLNFDISFQKRTEYKERGLADHFLSAANMLKPKELTGYDLFYIENVQFGVEKLFFKIKISNDIYPVSIVFNKNEFVSDNQEELAASIGEVVSNSQTHLMFNSFVREVNEKKLKTPMKG